LDERRSARLPGAVAITAAARNGLLEPVEWETALSFVAARVREIQAAHGRDSVRCLTAAA